MNKWRLIARVKLLQYKIPLSRYKKMLEMIEEMEDIKAYKEAKKQKSNWAPFEKAFATTKTRKK